MTIRFRTLRLPAGQAEALEAIAGVDGVSVNEEIQRAAVAHIGARQAYPDFQRRLQASLERNREILGSASLVDGPVSSWPSAGRLCRLVNMEGPALVHHRGSARVA